MGTFRFFLAICVALSHITGIKFKINFGQASVLAFYFLSGWLMARSFNIFERKKNNAFFYFMVDRILKLWPQFITCFLFSLGIFYYIGRELNLWRIITEIFILPTAYFRFFTFEPYTPPILLPSWSLGVEFQFYLLVPVLAYLSINKKIFLSYGFIFLHLFVLSLYKPIEHYFPCASHFLPVLCDKGLDEVLGYEFAGVTFVCFLIGHLCHEIIYKYNDKVIHLLFYWFIYSFSFMIIPAYSYLGSIDAYNSLYSMTFLVPTAFLIAFITTKKMGVNMSLPRTGNYSSLLFMDFLLGGLAYPVFLSHYTFKIFFEKYFGEFEVNRLLIPEILISTIFFSMLLFYLQNSIFDKLRFKFRGYTSTS